MSSSFRCAGLDQARARNCSPVCTKVLGFKPPCVKLARTGIIRTSGWLAITMSTEALMPGRSRGPRSSAWPTPETACRRHGTAEGQGGDRTNPIHHGFKLFVRNGIDPHFDNLPQLDLAAVHLVQFQFHAHRVEIGYLRDRRAGPGVVALPEGRIGGTEIAPDRKFESTFTTPSTGARMTMLPRYPLVFSRSRRALSLFVFNRRRSACWDTEWELMLAFTIPREPSDTPTVMRFFSPRWPKGSPPCWPPTWRAPGCTRTSSGSRRPIRWSSCERPWSSRWRCRPCPR